ncbi:ComEC/Rec2 family competence protein [Agromyces archimandritae]|uniref:ComEC/Rec2 family competence protein n=1 Tax=Agromyces archimandritae TaxID=2781962 RepID=A0A975IP44_9MICO|nr:ComEC/Rec2 family competence protein [Agromyces archimandritae]QTX04879.1 ComEC/Rec2 family competence protein [Agromyces archimandritae]
MTTGERAAPEQAAERARPGLPRQRAGLAPPAVAAWAAAWAATGLAAGAAWVVALGCWLLVAVLLAIGVVARVRARGGHPHGGLERGGSPRDGWARAARHPHGGQSPLVRLAAVLAVAVAGAALTASAAAAGLAAREASPLAGADRAELLVELDGAPSTFAGFGGETTVRAEGRAVAVDGRPIAPVPVVAMGGLSGAPRLGLGDRIAVEGRVSAEEPGERAAYRVSGVVRQAASAPLWIAWAAPLRAGLHDAAATLAGDGGALVPGLAIGDTSLVSDSLDQAMKQSSLSHLTAVSGANCTIVTAAAFAFGALLRLPRGARVVFALAALGAFVVLVTPEASVVRAAVMAAIVLVGLASGRGAGGLAALALAVVGLLAVDPWLSRDYGFALSVLATGGLLLLATPLAERLARWMPVPLAAALAIPAAAQLACQPVLVLLAPELALVGVAANLLAAPAAPIGTVVGLVAALLLPLPGHLGAWLLQLAWVPAAWIAAIARYTAELPGARMPWLPGPAGAILAGVAALALGWVLAGARSRRATIAAATAGALALAVPLGGAWLGPIVVGASRPADWSVAMCDVGQGDAVVLRADAVVMVDTGPDPAALDRCRRLLGIDRVDVLVLTHWDHDHVGGTSALAGDVGVVLAGPPDGSRSADALEPLERGGARVEHAVRGDQGAAGGVTWRVLWPADAGAEPGNDASIVLAADVAGIRMLLLGDLGEQAQRRLLREGVGGPYDIVKVAHHGSADQSAELYREAGAGIGLVGVGADNGYGHPTASALGMLADAGTRVLRTDRSGTIALAAAADTGFEVWTERASQEGPAGSAVARTLDAADRMRRPARREAPWRDGRAAGVVHAAGRRPGPRAPRRSRSSPGTRCARPPSYS